MHCITSDNEAEPEQENGNPDSSRGNRKEVKRWGNAEAQTRREGGTSQNLPASSQAARRRPGDIFTYNNHLPLHDAAQLCKYRADLRTTESLPASSPAAHRRQGDVVTCNSHFMMNTVA